MSQNFANQTKESGFQCGFNVNCILYRKVQSEQFYVDLGVPQGSYLGPLFLLYTLII